MKKSILLFLLAIALCHTIPAKAQWLEIDPHFPDSLNFIAWGISVVDENIVWGNPLQNIAVSSLNELPERQYYYKTTDGGQTWKLGEIKDSLHNWNSKALADLFALDSNIAWAINNHWAQETASGSSSVEYDSSEILKTIDGGDTWVHQTLPITHRNDLMGVRFFNQNEGAIWAEASDGGFGTYPVGWHIECYYTEDGGDTWQLAVTPPSIDEGWCAEKSFSGAYEVLGDNIWFGTTKSRVFHSSDRGKTWSASAPVWPGRMIETFAFRDSLNGIGFSAFDSTFNYLPTKMAFHTQDGGKTWTPLPPSTTVGGGWRTDMEYVPGSAGVYWGVSQTQSLLSNDNGNTWIHQDVPYLFWFTEFLSPKVGWGASAFHPTPSTSKLFMLKWTGDSLVRDERLNSTKNLAGSGIEGRADGAPATGRFYNPKGMAIDHSGNVYVADDYNHCIRKIALDGQISTLAGTGTLGYANGPGASAQFYRPQDVALDAVGNLYVADAGNFVIRKIAPDGTVSLFAGVPGVSGETDGPALQATFGWPAALAIDATGNLYVSGSGTIRKISTSGQVSTVHAATGVIWCLDADRYGNVYFADYYAYNVQKLTPDGQLSVLAGGSSGCADGAGSAAQFGSVEDLDADDFGNVYVADGRNARLRKIDAAGNVVTLVGSDCLNGYGLDQQPVDGPGDLAQLGRVRGILLKPSESLLVTAWDDDMVREIRLGSLPEKKAVVLSTSISPHYKTVPIEQSQPLIFSGVVVNIGENVLASTRMNVNIRKNGISVWTNSSSSTNIQPGSQDTLKSTAAFQPVLPGLYDVQISYTSASVPSFFTYRDAFTVSDSVMAADDGFPYFYDNIELSIPDGVASYGQIYETLAPDTLTGFTVNAILNHVSFYYSVYTMNAGAPGALLYTSDTVLGVSNGISFEYFHPLLRSIALPAGKYLFALTQVDPAGSIAMGVDTDHNDQSAWYLSPDVNIDDWTPLFHFWGEETAPVYMLRPVFGTPANTITETEEKTYTALQVQIAPNPVGDKLYVRVDTAPSEQFTLELYDLSGKLMLQTGAAGGALSTVDMSGWPGGLYLLRVMDESHLSVIKVVKQ